MIDIITEKVPQLKKLLSCINNSEEYEEAINSYTITEEIRKIVILTDYYENKIEVRYNSFLKADTRYPILKLIISGTPDSDHEIVCWRLPDTGICLEFVTKCDRFFISSLSYDNTNDRVDRTYIDFGTIKNYDKNNPKETLLNINLINKNIPSNENLLYYLQEIKYYVEIGGL